MSTAASANPTEVRSPSTPRRQYAYNSTDAPNRTQSMASRGSPSADAPHRSHSQSHSQSHSSRPPSSSRQASNLANVARRDFEQQNLARPSSSRRSSSADRYSMDRGSTALESPRPTPRASSRSRPPSYSSEAAPVGSPPANGTSADVGRGQPSASAAPRRRTTVTAQTGTWTLGKTIGAGSMGKVKLARNLETGEQVAIKIVPRQSTEDHRSQQERERADHSKEIRTAREAAIVTLVNHPYICGMRDVVRTHYHWYMLFEYVNGGQMLDYIISHGRLKEKQARKFGRQIASALDYCHRNSIVHRDLKIENILISKTGDIKIIDFGLSNLFSPRSLLKTFCGSLYFAAPELLQAKAYTGPEVDIWSFGIVLYVLVCGKVPFDDQSMPQLHAKIKKGVVEYPPWLSAECRHIISRMLVTDPRTRATLNEIMSHPWMTKGYNSQPDNGLPTREPLQLPLDTQVIDKMTGFDFGSAEYITTQLETIIQSEDYQRAVTQAQRRAQNSASEDRKKGMFDFYQRRKSASSKDMLTVPSSEALPLGDDPINAFSPLISIYYLVREKQEREKLESNPGALSMPRSPGEKPFHLPDLPAPEAALTNAATFEMAGEAPTGGRTRPRARTHGEDEIRDGMGQSRNGSLPQQTPKPTAPESTPTKKEGPAAGLLRRFSTRKHKDVDREKISKPAPTPTVAISAPENPNAQLRKSFSMRKTRDRDTPPSAYRSIVNNHPELLAPPTPDEPPASQSEGTPKKLMGLSRSTSVNSGDGRRRWSRRGDNGATQSAAGSESERSSLAEAKEKFADAPFSDNDAQSTPRSSSTRTRSLGQGRRQSVQLRRSGRDRPQDQVPEETDAELAEELAATSRANQSQETMKPVYLKGLFSVSTTSSKPLSFIRADIIRVLKQLGVDYREVKSGFSCRHVPSIDLNKVVDNPTGDGRPSLLPHRRKISFAGLRGHSGERDEYVEQVQQQQQQQQRNPPSTPRTQSRRYAENSNTNSDDDSETDDDQRPQSHHHQRRGSNTVRPKSPNALSPAPNASSSRPAGETTTQVQSDLGQSMILKFEILVVKVPFLSLHGLQFKKLDGGTWQYKKMAETILAELKL